MQVLSLDAWPFVSRMLLQLAQRAADQQHHATVSGAHVARMLLDMEPARRILGDAAALAALDAAVGKALLLAPKSFGKNAIFDENLARALTGGMLASVDVLRVATTGAVLTDVHAAICKHAEGISTLLDAPLIGDLFFAVGSAAPEHAAARKRCPHLVNAFVDARRRKHRRVTTRHVIAARLRSFYRNLTQLGLARNGEVATRLDLLLEVEPQDTDGKGPALSSRLLGAVAGAVAAAAAQPDDPDVDYALVSASFAGDTAIDFVMDAFNDAITAINASLESRESS